LEKFQSDLPILIVQEKKIDRRRKEKKYIYIFEPDENIFIIFVESKYDFFFQSRFIK
jgi:hypothetical protein